MGSVAQRINVLGGPLQVVREHCLHYGHVTMLTVWFHKSMQDYGRHFLAVEVTDEFLEFSAKQGNDLRGGMPQPDGSVTGLTGGCKWCLCVSRWKEAFMNKDKLGDKVVPKVILEATHKDALDKSDITLDQLKQFAAKTTEPASPQQRFDVGR